MRFTASSLLLAGVSTCAAIAAPSSAPVERQTNVGDAAEPDDSTSAAIDARAARIVDAMTLDEQIMILRPLRAHTFAAVPGSETMPEHLRGAIPPGAIGSAAFAPGVARLGWPALQESDAGLGVGNLGGYIRPGDEATALPATYASAASFDPLLARSAGAVIGEEAHAKGFNVQLAGGANLVRDPRAGRNFEQAGEDPLLAGRTVGATIAGIQSRHVASTVKHYALNDQETGRKVLDARIGEGAARESDLLAFRIAIEEGRPASVMCAYNKVNGSYACENAFLLNRVLKTEWGFPGWVMSDWGAAHSLVPAIRSGLDQESPQSPSYFAGLRAAVEKGEVSRSKVRGMALRIVRSIIAVGGLDHPARPGGAIDQAAHAAVAQAIAEQGAVLLKNDGLLPLAPSVKRVLLVGGHADKWVLSGGGSSQVNPFGGLQRPTPVAAPADIIRPAYIASSPMRALQALRPDVTFAFDSGEDADRAARAARAADVVIVFATQPTSEMADSADLSLPDGQDALIRALAAANPRTGVVLETGNPVVMPWLDGVRAVLEVWYPGQRGGEAIAALLSGRASPSGRLPVTFPRSVDQLPRPRLDGAGEAVPHTDPAPFAVDYDKEGSDVGYRWFQRTGQTPLFPFGYGLTYTKFRYSGLRIAGTAPLAVRVKVTNVGPRAGTDVPQLYVAPPGRTHRLAGWARVALAPGETREVVLTADPRVVASWTMAGWRRAAGRHDICVASSASLDGPGAAVALTSGN